MVARKIMPVDLKLLKKIRQETSASVADIREALEKAAGDQKKALGYLKERAEAIAVKKSERDLGSGLVETYMHPGGKVGAMVEVGCETDFVARTDDFKNLAHEVAMQITAMAPADVEELLKQDYIRDSSKTVGDLVKEAVGKVGENIKIRRFQRFALGE